MPQATDELRDQMEKWFGDAIDDYGPYAFLRSRGYSDKGGMLFPPVPAHTVSREEGLCIDFLFQEWDYGYSLGRRNESVDWKPAHKGWHGDHPRKHSGIGARDTSLSRSRRSNGS